MSERVSHYIKGLIQNANITLNRYQYSVSMNCEIIRLIFLKMFSWCISNPFMIKDNMVFGKRQ